MELYVGLDVSLKETSICVVDKAGRNDALGLARIMQCGWYKEVRVKSLDSHGVRAVLNSRALLVKIKRNLGNQVRGLLKNVGLVIGKAQGNVFTARVEELVADHADLADAVRWRDRPRLCDAPARQARLQH